MKLQITGTPEGPDLLLLSGQDLAPEELCAALPGLAGKYRLLLGRDGTPEALYEALRGADVIRLWGAYGLGTGAGALLAFLAAGRMDVRTAVTEGPFALPEASLGGFEGTLICWKGGRDRKAKKSWEALKEQLPGVHSLTLGKLKAGETYLSRRPDLMEKRLIATFGEATVLRSRDVLLCPEETAWRRLSARPAGALTWLLPETEPLRLDDTRHTQRLLGRGGGFLFWDHLTTLESAGDGAVLCSDQAVFAAGKHKGLTRTISRLYLAGEQKRRAALLARK